MPSPFPGMDPYLEVPHLWGNFHDSFLTYSRDAINDALPSGYVAMINQRVELVERDGESPHPPGPDFFVVAEPRATRNSHAEAPGVATLDPVTIPATYLDEERQMFLEVLWVPERRVVTVVELLSPSNKDHRDRNRYLAKRDDVLHSPANLVELDLLRAGRRVPLDRRPPSADYYAFIYRADRRPDCHVYGWTVRDRLPVLPLPLDPGRIEPLIDYQALFELTYHRARFAELIDYQQEPPAPLSDEARAWAAEVARASRQRAT